VSDCCGCGDKSIIREGKEEKRGEREMREGGKEGDG